MMQGDAYGLPIDILNEDGNMFAVVTPEDVSEVEVMIGHLRKSYADGEIAFNSDTKKWTVLLTQEDTFGLRPVRVKVQLRIKWKSGGVEGCDLGYHNVRESLSKEVL